MTNQQAPEALRLAEELEIPIAEFPTPTRLEQQAAAELRRLHAENERLAALVEAQQPAPSAAVVVNPDPHAELRKTWQPGQRWQARSFRNGQWGPWTDAVASEPFWFPHQDYRRHPDDLAPQPSPTPQADSQPAPQGETNVQLDTDSNAPAPGQQRNMAGTVALGQPVGHGSDSAAGDPSAQGDKLLTVAERNIRSFLRSAVFKSESDREAALSCVDVLWAAARAPADSVTAPAGGGVAGWQMVPIKPTHDMLCALSGEWHPSRHQPERYAAMLAAAPTPPAQAADSVLEDAARLGRERICAAIKAEDDYCVDQGDYMLDSDDCIKIVRGEWVRPDFAIDAARKQGGA